MKLCLECDALFEEGQTYVERHGLDTPPYEVTKGCPSCGGNYVDALLCAVCGEWITGNYIKIGNHMTVCDNCYSLRSVEDDL